MVPSPTNMFEIAKLFKSSGRYAFSLEQQQNNINSGKLSGLQKILSVSDNYPPSWEENQFFWLLGPDNPALLSQYVEYTLKYKSGRYWGCTKATAKLFKNPIKRPHLRNCGTFLLRNEVAVSRDKRLSWYECKIVHPIWYPSRTIFVHVLGTCHGSN